MDLGQLLDLRGGVALVSVAYGIYGAPISEALAEAGAHVVITSGNYHQTPEVTRGGSTITGNLLSDPILAMPSSDRKETSR